MNVMPPLDVPTQIGLLQQTQLDYAAYGVTTVQKGAVTDEGLEILQAAADQGKLLLDVVSYPYVTMTIEGLKKFPPSTDYDNHYRIGGIKITLDGSPQGKTAWLTQPYLHPPHGQDNDYVGYPTLSDEEAQAFVDYAFESGVPLLAHANGDAASDQAIKDGVTVYRR